MQGNFSLDEQASFLYGQDSIEMASDKDIYDQSNLTQRILDAEKQYSTSSINTSFFSSEYFEKPALYRVLFMGSAVEDERKEIFKKLSQGFVQVIRLRQTYNPPFKELKHNLLLLSDEDEQELISDVYEDIGVSMIEADFTWTSNAMTYAPDPERLLLQYAWKQCPNPRQLPAAWLEPELKDFRGHMHTDRTPNGIDLCVYFYNDSEHDARVEKDLALLCTLRKFGIYVLPLTTTRDEALKSRFANLLTRHKVRCLDLGNLEVGQQPSFFYPPTMHDRINRLQDLECTQANLPRVATYQILAIDQFCAIKDHAIFQLLKRTRERQAIREEMKEEYIQKKQWVESEDSQVYDHLNTSTQQPLKKKKKWHVDYGQLFRALSIFAVCIMIWNFYRHSWTAEFKMNSNYQFTLSTRDARGRLLWDDQDPQVWLNHRLYIPIEKIENKPGQYQLKLDVLSLQSISFELSVNTTTHSFHTKSVHYLLINPTTPPHRHHTHTIEQEQKVTLKKAWDTALFFINHHLFKLLLDE